MINEQRIGIALSGGGSRAIAFHLGCLRALNSVGILQKCMVMSCVSGGSVIGAMYAVHDGSFEEFEVKVTDFLAEGLHIPAIKTAVTSTEGIRAFVSWCILVLAMILRWLLKLPKWLAKSVLRCILKSDASHPSPAILPRRFASRTTIIQRTLERKLFGDTTLKDIEKNNTKFIAVSTELRTGSAFYFSPDESGSWRFGKVKPDKISLAKAVTASAAYPALLPALDEIFTFNKLDGSSFNDRVTLTDGGIYDNLGLSPLWPDRDDRISVKVPKPNIIIACRAGYGLRLGEPSIFMFSRLLNSFFTTLERAQNASLKRLFDLKDAGHLDSIILPYLGQSDQRLNTHPSDFVRREEVTAYPTNFSAMSDEWIEKLSKRGEQTTLAVLNEHHPELIGVKTK